MRFMVKRLMKCCLTLSRALKMRLAIKLRQAINTISVKEIYLVLIA